MLFKTSQSSLMSLGIIIVWKNFTWICLRQTKYIVMSFYCKVHCLMLMIAYSPRLINYKALTTPYAGFKRMFLNHVFCPILWFTDFSWAGCVSPHHIFVVWYKNHCKNETKTSACWGFRLIFAMFLNQALDSFLDIFCVWLCTSHMIHMEPRRVHLNAFCVNDAISCIIWKFYRLNNNIIIIIIL